MTPHRLYRALAVAETVTWTLLLLGMVLKYLIRTTDLGVRIGGGLHGFVFLAYCATTVLIAVDRPWRLRTLLAGLGSAVVPYLTLPFEASVARHGLLGSHWRLLQQAPNGQVQLLVATALRRPWVALVAVLVVLAGVFVGLVSLGPPTQWGS